MKILRPASLGSNFTGSYKKRREGNVNKIFFSSSFFIDLKDWNVDAFKRIYFHMIMNSF